MKWNTDLIIADLKRHAEKKQLNITFEKDPHPDGGYYCRKVTLWPGSNKRGNAITVIGFNTNDISDVDAPKENIEQVEIRDHYSDSDGGLSKGVKPEIKEIYRLAWDYFDSKDIDIVNQLKDYF